MAEEQFDFDISFRGTSNQLRVAFEQLTGRGYYDDLAAKQQLLLDANANLAEQNSRLAGERAAILNQVRLAELEQQNSRLLQQRTELEDRTRALLNMSTSSLLLPSAPPTPPPPPPKSAATTSAATTEEKQASVNDMNPTVFRLGMAAIVAFVLFSLVFSPNSPVVFFKNGLQPVPVQLK